MYSKLQMYYNGYNKTNALQQFVANYYTTITIMFNLFSILNNSQLFNATITAILYGLIAYIVVCFFLGSISDICKQRKERRALINSIPYLSYNELRKLAKAEGVKLGRWNRDRIANHLILTLA